VKKSTKTNAAQARTAARVKQQRIDWKRVVTVGIDLGDRFSHFCALDDDGAVVSEGRVATTPGAIELFFKTSRKRIAIEAGTHSPWMSRLLARLGHESSWLLAHAAADLREPTQERSRGRRVSGASGETGPEAPRRDRAPQRGWAMSPIPDPRTRHARAEPCPAHSARALGDQVTR
jgi:hypothetical protein